MNNNTTLIYIEKDDCYLMMHRNKKAEDENKDKWVGIGGHMENGESPKDCIKREVKEETGLDVGKLEYKGFITFVCGDYTEYMHLFKGYEPEGTLKTDCPEGTLCYVPKDKLEELNLWEGDYLFLELLDEDIPFFSMKLVYDKDGKLLSDDTDICVAKLEYLIEDFVPRPVVGYEELLEEIKDYEDKEVNINGIED